MNWNFKYKAVKPKGKRRRKRENSLGRNTVVAINKTKNKGSALYFILRQWERAIEQRTNQYSAFCLDLKRQMDEYKIEYEYQVPVGNFIPDFLLPKYRIVIEVDGGYHGEPEQIVKDGKRDIAFTAANYKVLRFTNAEVKDGMAIDVIKRLVFKP